MALSPLRLHDKVFLGEDRAGILCAKRDKFGRILMKLMILVLTAVLLTGCTTQRITCWSESTGHINYMGGFDMETNATYIVDVADGVRDFYQKKNCQLLTGV